jgi:hypothetical protein
MKALNNTWLATSALILTALVCSANVGVAAEKVATDPTGTWKVARGNPDTKTKGSERTLKL